SSRLEKWGSRPVLEGEEVDQTRQALLEVYSGSCRRRRTTISGPTKASSITADLRYYSHRLGEGRPSRPRASPHQVRRCAAPDQKTRLPGVQKCAVEAMDYVDTAAERLPGWADRSTLGGSSRQGAWPHGAGHVACPRRRGD